MKQTGRGSPFQLSPAKSSMKSLSILVPKSPSLDQYFFKKQVFQQPARPPEFK